MVDGRMVPVTSGWSVYDVVKNVNKTLNGEKSFGNSLVRKRTTLCATMSQLFHLWVAFGE